jgi:hypothetical protein
MNFKSSTLSSFLTEIVFSATTESQIEPLVLYHYTNDEAKNKIVDEERQTVTLRFTRASQFTDKNECIHIIEPYVHAYGCLYDSGEISKDFYLFLKSIKADNLNLGQKDPWIFCFTAEGNSKFMKEKYAPGDGWLIELLKLPFESLESNFASSDTMYPNYIFLADVEYSYLKMKTLIQEMLSHLYHCYQSDTNPEEEKKKLAYTAVVQYLSMYNLFYKSESYKDEKEIRLICNINPELKEWTDPDDNDTTLYFENEYLFLKLSGNSYRQSFHNLDVYNSIEINKPVITSQEIRDTLKKRNEVGGR